MQRQVKTAETKKAIKIWNIEEVHYLYLKLIDIAIIQEGGKVEFYFNNG